MGRIYHIDIIFLLSVSSTGMSIVPVGDLESGTS